MGDKRNGMAVESIRQDFQYAFTPVKLPLKESIATTILFMFVTD